MLESPREQAAREADDEADHEADDKLLFPRVLATVDVGVSAEARVAVLGESSRESATREAAWGFGDRSEMPYAVSVAALDNVTRSHKKGFLTALQGEGGEGGGGGGSEVADALACSAKRSRIDRSRYLFRAHLLGLKSLSSAPLPCCMADTDICVDDGRGSEVPHEVCHEQGQPRGPREGRAGLVEHGLDELVLAHAGSQAPP